MPNPQLLTLIPHWYKDVEESGLRSFATIMNTIKINYDEIVNYFENRITNAAADREAAPEVIIQCQNQSVQISI